ncbi:MAG: substrate-binding domain-containing protein [Desulfocapsa sp.]|nr:substrate-binding domain-containing protein [Desulfocapsa sp.]
MEAIIPSFIVTSGITVQSAYGSTGKLYAQIQNGAPWDLFLAADHDWPQIRISFCLMSFFSP